MKASPHIRLIILLFGTIACVDKNSRQAAGNNKIIDTAGSINTVIKDTFETGKIIAHVVCKTDTGKSYALYIPLKGNREALPVIYFFDPHGDGSLPLVKYKALADTFGFILAGSNNSKNGNDWATTENIWGTLFDDSQKRLKIDHKRIYICGFSGGAKVAAYLAIRHSEVKGVIADGAGLPDATPAGNFNFSFTAIAGEGDMNMTELVAISNAFDKTQTRHRILLFRGKHEWAPEKTMYTAFTGLQMDAMHEKLIPAGEVFIANYVTKSKARIAAFSKTNNYVKAEEECTFSISLLNSLTNEANWFKAKNASIKNDPGYKKQRVAEQKLFDREQNTKAEYVLQFQQGHVNYWTKTINNLQTKAPVQTAEGAMYQRLLAYLSLAFYSISNQLISGNQDKEALYFVNLYKMVDATNSEAWYFSAILNARNNNIKQTTNDLLKAVEYGFTGKNRMSQQPEFRNIQAQIKLGEILGKVKK